MPKMPEKTPELWFQLWNVLPEPIKAAILYVILAISMAFKSDGRTWKDKLTDCTAGAVLVLIGGSAASFLGFSEGWTYILAGALGGYGLAPTKAFVKDLADKAIAWWFARKP